MHRQKTWPNKEVQRVNKAIILPVKYTRDQDVNRIDSDFRYGGYVDHASRWFYIDPRDLPSGYEIKQDDFIVYRGKQYEIKEIIDTEFDALYQIKATALEGVVPEQVFDMTAKTLMALRDESEVVKNA